MSSHAKDAAGSSSQPGTGTLIPTRPDPASSPSGGAASRRPQRMQQSAVSVGSPSFLEAATGNASATKPPAHNRRSLISKAQREAVQVNGLGATAPRVAGDMLNWDDADNNMHPRTRELAQSLHTASKAEAVVTKSEKESLKFHLCIQALSEGCIQTYTHLFELAHRKPVCVDELSQVYFSIPDDKLSWVQQQLSSIEVLRRQSEFRMVFERCIALADYFEEERDLEEAAWHYEAAQRYALESLDRPLEQEVRGAYAAFFERTGKFTKAAERYISIFRLAVALKDDELAKSVCISLVRVYEALGNASRASDPLVAKLYYEKAAKYAKRSACRAEEGRSYKALGQINEQTGNLSKALTYHRTYRDLSHAEQIHPEECDAQLQVAGLEERLGRNEEATKSLKEALVLAEHLNDSEKICRARMQLGEVCRSEGDDEAAMQHFRASFEAACNAGRQELIDSARVAMGFAIGQFYFLHAGDDRGYLPIVCEDIQAQLRWMSSGEL